VGSRSSEEQAWDVAVCLPFPVSSSIDSVVVVRRIASPCGCHPTCSLHAPEG